MEKEHLKVFYLLDEYKYKVDKNKNLKKILNTLDSRYSEDDVQAYINKLISWYYVKYSDKLLNTLLKDKNNVDTSIFDIMSFEQLHKSYGAFEEEFFNSSNNDIVILQKHLVIMAGWGLIYYKRSNPEFGYYRAKRLLDDFNVFYSWNLPSDIYKEVFNRDYSPDNIENKKLIEMKKKKHHNKKSKKRFSLFSR